VGDGSGREKLCFFFLTGSSIEGGIFLHVCHIEIDPHLSVTHG
jgi:hypothetical protein